MSKQMMLSFISQMIAMAGGGKTAVERMKYVPAGVQDGELYAHNGFIWGKVDLPDMVWIEVDETKKARLADTQFKVYQEKFEALVNIDNEAREAFPDGDEVGEVADNCDSEVLIDIKEAIDEGALDDAKEIMKELKSKTAIAEAKTLIAKAEKPDNITNVDAELLAELVDIIDDVGDGDWSDDDINDAEDIIDEIGYDEVKAQAQKLFLDASTVVDDLTEEEAIKLIKSSINDGNKKEATELLKFIKDERQNRRYSRKVKGL